MQGAETHPSQMKYKGGAHGKAKKCNKLKKDGMN